MSIIQQIEDQVVDALRNFRVPVKVLIGKDKIDQLHDELRSPIEEDNDGLPDITADNIHQLFVNTSGGQVTFEKSKDSQELTLVSKHPTDPNL